MRYFLLSAMLAVGAAGVPVRQLPAASPERSTATVNVTLPADAELTIDGQATHSTSGQRRFITPPLEAGQDYWYTFTARFVRQGRMTTNEQRVWVRAGRETVVSLGQPSDALVRSEVPNGYRNDYGAGSETGSYYAARETPGSGSRRVEPSPATRSEGRSYSPSFKPIRWGSDPSDPFYQKGDW
jgi:uncharacterized protein (TIGR03000 family)